MGLQDDGEYGKTALNTGVSGFFAKGHWTSVALDVAGSNPVGHPFKVFHERKLAVHFFKSIVPLGEPARMNEAMSTAETFASRTAPDVLADLEEVLRQSERGIVRDPELVKRVAERSRCVQEELRRKHGEIDIAVDLIREIRDEE
jgi:hypothetical protein